MSRKQNNQKGLLDNKNVAILSAIITACAVIIAAIINSTWSTSDPVYLVLPTPHILVAEPAATTPTITTTSTPITIDSPEYHFFKGEEMFGKHNYQAAIEHYTVAKVLRPDYAEAYKRRAMAHWVLDDWDEAIEDLSYYLTLRNDDCGAYVALGNVFYNDLKDFASAETNFANAIEHCPTPTTFVYRADARFYQGKYQEAIEDYTEAENRDSSSFGSFLRRGSAYEQIGDLEQARRDYESAAKLRPDDEFVVEALDRLK